MQLAVQTISACDHQERVADYQAMLQTPADGEEEGEPEIGGMALWPEGSFFPDFLRAMFSSAMDWIHCNKSLKVVRLNQCLLPVLSLKWCADDEIWSQFNRRKQALDCIHILYTESLKAGH